MIEFELLVRYIDGAASPGEAMLVDDWINESDENRQFFQLLHEAWLEHGKEIYVVPDVLAEWNRFQKIYRPNIPPARKTLPFIKTAAAACIFLAVGVLAFWFIKRETILANKEQVIAVTTSPKTVILPDSSVVQLETNSALRYPRDFRGKERKVRLDGDATFLISHDKEKPFIIDLKNGIHAKVLGTSFRLQQRNDTTWLKVLTGKVAFYNAKDSVTVHAGEEAFYATQIISFVPGSRYIKNKTGSFYFNNQSLQAVTTELQTYFNAAIVIKNQELNNCRITATLNHKTLEEIIPIISATLNIQVETHEGTIYLSGKGCN